MPLAAPAASQATSFQLQPLPFGRLSYHSFPAPGVNENSLALPVRMVLTLPIFTACCGQHYRGDKMLRFIPSGLLIFRHMGASTTQQPSKQHTSHSRCLIDRSD